MQKVVNTSILIGIGLIVALMGSDQSKTTMVTKETVRTFYRGFRRLTRDPLPVNPAISMACGGVVRISSKSNAVEIEGLVKAPKDSTVQGVLKTPSNPGQDKKKRAFSPHANARVHIYVNTLADQATAQKLKTFPRGAIIVKEKLADDGSVNGLGGMIKRAPGYDVENGDWEYFYSDDIVGFSIGRLKNCAECHADSKETDYVFKVWQLADKAVDAKTRSE